MRFVEVHRLLVALPIHHSSCVLQQEFQNFSTGPYQNQLHIEVPFQKIVKFMIERLWQSLGGERGQHLDVRHGTIALHLHTLPRKDVVCGHLDGMNHRCPALERFGHEMIL